jgi:multiple sugar transport system substrate-binding protein
MANEILLMYYNKDMFDNAGVAYPPARVQDAWTWDQFVAAAKKLTFDRNGRTPADAGFDRNNIVQYGAMVENLTWQLEVWCLSNGSGFYHANGTQVTIDNPAAIEAIQKVADLHLKDNVSPMSPGLTDDGVQRSLIAGHVAMTTNGQWNVGTSLSSARDDQGLNYGVAVLPYMKEKVTINTGGAQAVFKGPREAAAMEYVSWLSAKENTWFLIELGIWMPTKLRYYTDEALTREWVMNPAFPPYNDYKSAVVDYAREYAKPTAWYYTPNTNSFTALLQSVLGDVWTGAKTARDAITQNIAALRNAHAGR